MRRLPIFVLACLLVLLIGCANPPTFTWPERIPQIAPVAESFPTPYDKWKKARRVMNNPGLVAGAAKVDLTPTDITGTWMAGYMGGKHPTGLHLPITGRVLVLDDGKTSLVMINVDFVGLMADRVDQVRREISRVNGRDVLIASTHTHAGPDTMGMWGPAIMMAIPTQSGVNEAYMQRVARDLAKAVFAAARSAEPVKLSAAEISVPEGISENAHVPGYKDDIMTVLRVESADGARPVATLINYACHAEFLGQNNTGLSADFPGYLYPEVERLEGGVAMFFNGAVGGIIVPAMPRHTETLVRVRDAGARRAGRVLASYASKALQNRTVLDVRHIEIRRSSFSLPVENETLMWLGKKGIFSRDMSEGKLNTEVWAINLGELSILSVPGEIFPSLGFQYKDWMPGKYKMLFGLSNDELGYIMTEKEFADPLYGYEITVSLGPQTGPLLSAAVQNLYPESCK
jgi:hypothetical protein